MSNSREKKSSAKKIRSSQHNIINYSNLTVEEIDEKLLTHLKNIKKEDSVNPELTSDEKNKFFKMLDEKQKRFILEIFDTTLKFKTQEEKNNEEKALIELLHVERIFRLPLKPWNTEAYSLPSLKIALNEIHKTGQIVTNELLKNGLSLTPLKTEEENNEEKNSYSIRPYPSIEKSSSGSSESSFFTPQGNNPLSSSPITSLKVKASLPEGVEYERILPYAILGEMENGKLKLTLHIRDGNHIYAGKVPPYCYGAGNIHFNKNDNIIYIDDTAGGLNDTFKKIDDTFDKNRYLQYKEFSKKLLQYFGLSVGKLHLTSESLHKALKQSESHQSTEPTSSVLKNR